MSVIGITGHRGFVGAAVVTTVEARGHEARRVDLPRIDATPDDLAHAVDRWFEEDPVRHRNLVDALAGCDAVINAAGSATPDSDDRRMLWSSNTLLPILVARAADEAGVPRLVHVSSAAVQGDRPVLDESTDLEPQSPYAGSKADAERALQNDRTRRPPQTVIYRPTSVMGPNRPTTRRLLALFRRIVPADPTTPLPLALVGNVADAAVTLATSMDPPAVATHPSEGITIGDLAEVAGGRVIPIPGAVTRTGISALRRLESWRPGVAGVRRRAQLLADGQRIDATALEALGWTPPVGLDGYQALIHPEREGPPRIAYLITRSDTIAGAQVHVRDLSEAMTKAGHAVRVFVGGNGPLVDQLRDRGVDVLPLPSLGRELGPGDVRALLDIRRQLKAFDPELLSCHSSKSGILGRVAARSLGIPTVFTAHGWSFADGIPNRQRQAFTLLERAMAPLATKLITVAHKDRELADRAGVGRPDQHVTIHNAVHDVDPSLQADPGRTPPTIVCIARLEAQKDHELLFHALARLHPTPRVVLVGDGPKESELRTLARDLGIAEHVEFLGLRHDVPEILGQAQLYVLVSHWEGLPRSIIEALRAGLPVIATDVGGVSELVEDGQNGRLLPHADLDALHKALDELLADAELRAAMGTESRRRYEDHFTFARVLAETRGVYADLLGVPC